MDVGNVNLSETGGIGELRIKMAKTKYLVLEGIDQ